MSLSVVECRTLQALDKGSWAELLSASRGSVFQGLPWLEAWWSAWGEGESVILTVLENNSLVGAGAFFIDHKRTLRFIGEEHADYGQILAAGNRADVSRAIIEALFARRARWDRMALESVRHDSLLYEELVRRGAHVGESICCPRVQFSARSLDSLIGKSSLKRHARDLGALGEVRYLHLDSAQAIEPWLDQFFAQHIERWALTGTPSLFLNPRNEAFYRALAGSAVAGGAVLLTVVLLKDSPAAMHFGFRSQGDILWYKSTFDPRLSEVGPGEVLLAELLRHAHREAAQGLDFTRGGEAFKRRFASETRYVSSLEIWPSSWATVQAKSRFALKGQVLSVLEAVRLRHALSDQVRRTHRAVLLWQRQGAHAAVRRARVLWQSARQVSMEFYAKDFTRAAQPSVLPPSFSVRCITTVAELLECVSVRDSNYRHLLEYAARRLASRDRLWVGIVEQAVVAFGWETSRSPLQVTEIKAKLSFNAETSILYDFQVLATHRRQGYYKALLSHINPPASARWLVIYARADNSASRAGIESAGYSQFSSMHRRGRLISQRLSSAWQGPPLTAVPAER